MGGILAIWNDCTSGHEAAYEEWYQDEHLMLDKIIGTDCHAYTRRPFESACGTVKSWTLGAYSEHGRRRSDTPSSPTLIRRRGEARARQFPRTASTRIILSSVGDQIEQSLAVRIERRATVARAGQFSYTARCRPPLDPADCGRPAETEHPRRFPSVSSSSTSAMPSPFRVSLRHRATPRCCQSNRNLICTPLGTP